VTQSIAPKTGEDVAPLATPLSWRRTRADRLTLEGQCMSLLYLPVTLGPYTFKNRLVMSPMTRSRALGNVPGDLMAEYYKQRASSAGLVITEGTSPSPNGLGYPRVPGIFSAAQVAGWKKITDAVHGKGAKIFVQLMHTGRIGHQNNLPQGASVIGPSAIVAAGEMYTDTEGAKPHPTPKAMTEADIKTAIGEFEHSAKNAVAAGFEASSCTVGTVICSSNSSVRIRTSAPTPMAARSRTGRASCSMW